MANARCYWTVTVDWPDDERREYQFYAASLLQAVKELLIEFPDFNTRGIVSVVKQEN